MMNTHNFFAELKRRNAYKVAQVGKPGLAPPRRGRVTVNLRIRGTAAAPNNYAEEKS